MNGHANPASQTSLGLKEALIEVVLLFAIAVLVGAVCGSMSNIFVGVLVSVIAFLLVFSYIGYQLTRKPDWLHDYGALKVTAAWLKKLGKKPWILFVVWLITPLFGLLCILGGFHRAGSWIILVAMTVGIGAWTIGVYILKTVTSRGFIVSEDIEANHALVLRYRFTDANPTSNPGASSQPTGAHDPRRDFQGIYRFFYSGWVLFAPAIFKRLALVHVSPDTFPQESVEVNAADGIIIGVDVLIAIEIHDPIAFAVNCQNSLTQAQKFVREYLHSLLQLLTSTEQSSLDQTEVPVQAHEAGGDTINTYNNLGIHFYRWDSENNCTVEVTPSDTEGREYFQQAWRAEAENNEYLPKVWYSDALSFSSALAAAQLVMALFLRGELDRQLADPQHGLNLGFHLKQARVVQIKLSDAMLEAQERKGVAQIEREEVEIEGQAAAANTKTIYKAIQESTPDWLREKVEQLLMTGDLSPENLEKVMKLVKSATPNPTVIAGVNMLLPAIRNLPLLLANRKSTETKKTEKKEGES